MGYHRWHNTKNAYLPWNKRNSTFHCIYASMKLRMVACCQRFSVLVQNYHGTRLFGKLLHIFRQTCHTRRYGRFIVSRKFRTFQSTIILITLKLTAHQSTEINIYLTVIILKYGRIHGITSPDRIRFRHKRAVRRVTDSHSQTEDVRMSLAGK